MQQVKPRETCPQQLHFLLSRGRLFSIQQIFAPALPGVTAMWPSEPREQARRTSPRTKSSSSFHESGEVLMKKIGTFVAVLLLLGAAAPAAHAQATNAKRA